MVRPRHFGQSRPVLLAWGASHDRLREITRAGVQDALDQLQGQRRYNTPTALKSLFRFAAKYRRTFANPTAGLSVPHGSIDTVLTLTDAEITAIETTATTPAQRLAVTLAAVHAARGDTIRNLTLDDVDSPKDRLTVVDQVRPLGELTRKALMVWAAATGMLDGRPIVATGSDDRTLRVWDASTGRRIGQYAFPAGVWNVAVAPDGRLVAAFGSNMAVLAPR